MAPVRHSSSRLF
jgi:hypothetical protein